MWFHEPADAATARRSASRRAHRRDRHHAPRSSSSSASTRSSSPASASSRSARLSAPRRRGRATSRAHPPRRADHVRPRSSKPRSTSPTTASSRRARGAGRAGRDFVTSPEVGPLFGALRRARARPVVARRSASPTRSSWSRPARATAGSRATCCAAEPDVRAGAALRARRALGRAARPSSASGSPLEPADEALGPFVRGDGDDAPMPGRRHGPDRHRARRAARARRSTGVVLANELLDNLPFGSSSAPTTAGTRCGSALDGDALRRGARARGRRARGRGRRRRDATVPRRGPAPGADAASSAWLARVRGGAARTASSCVVDYVADGDELVERGPSGLAAHLPRTTSAAARRSTRRASRTSPPTSSVEHLRARARRAPASRSSADATPGRVARRRSASTSSSTRAGARGTQRAHVGDLDALRRPQPGHRSRRAHRPGRPRRPPRRSSFTR